MPNHVDHDCWISGPPTEVQKLIDEALTPEGDLNDSFLIKYPEEYEGNEGYNMGGYRWCLDNWGTKWGTYDGQGVLEQPLTGNKSRRIYLSWNTAWGPAFPLYDALAQKYPKLTIKISYFEQGMGYCGRLTYQRGKRLKHRETDNYRGGRGG